MGSDDAVSMRTQQELLKSRSLAERVIDELRLDQLDPAGAGGPAAGSQPADRRAATGRRPRQPAATTSTASSRATAR